MRRLSILLLFAIVATCFTYAATTNTSEVEEQGRRAFLEKKYAKAISCYSAAIRRGATNPLVAYYIRGIAYRKTRQYSKAIKDFTECLTISPNNVDVWVQRSLAYFEMGKYENAMEDSNSAIRLEPKRAMLYYNRGIVQQRLEKYGRAIIDQTNAIALDSKYTDAYIARGAAFFNMGLFNNAIEDYTEAIRLQPTEWMAYCNRGLAYHCQGRSRRAIHDFRQVLKLQPKHAPSLNRLAWELATCPNAAIRDGKEAVMYAKAACHYTAWTNPSYLTTLAAAYAEQRDFSNAIKWQAKALTNKEFSRRCGKPAGFCLTLYKEGKPYRVSDPRHKNEGKIK